MPKKLFPTLMPYTHDHTMHKDDVVALVTTSTVDVTMLLPDTIDVGRELVIKKVAGPNNKHVIVAVNIAGQMIDGATSVDLVKAGECLTIIFNGTTDTWMIKDWYIPQ